MQPGDELHLAATLELGLILLGSAYALARRWTACRLAAAADALLLTFAGQYLAVGIAGLLGVLSGGGIALASGLLLVPALGFCWRRRAIPAGPRGRWSAPAIAAAAVAAFASAYLGAGVYVYRYLPPIATDPLAYHLPAAAQWLQQHRLGLFPTWFFNPANTYSPLAGSFWIAWLMGLMGTDTLARFVQIPAAGLIFLGSMHIARALAAPGASGAPGAGDAGATAGATDPSRASIASDAMKSPQAVASRLNRGDSPSLVGAALLAAAVVVARPILAESVHAKDDLYVAGLFAAVVAGLSPARLRDGFGPWRVGIALGLLLATKYTALMTLPMLLLAADAPFRAGWRWRHWGVMLAVVAALAGPWFLRNLLLTGNPLFPLDVRLAGVHLLTGPLAPGRSLALADWAGRWRVLTHGYFRLPEAVLSLALIGWLAALLRLGQKRGGDPLLRVAVIGPVLGIGLFALTSPYPEVRFCFPAFVLLLTAPAGLGALAPRSVGSWVLPAMLFVAAVATSYDASLARTFIVPFAMAALASAAAVAAVLSASRLWPRLPALAALALVTGGAWMVYVYWPSYLQTCRAAPAQAWPEKYPGGQGQLWAQAGELIPRGATVAYTNTALVYPLFGFDLDRRPVHAPVRADRTSLADLGPLPRGVPGERIAAEAARAALADPDRAAWLRNLQASGATYLLIARAEAGANPPELAWALADPATFEPLVQNAWGLLFQIHRK